MDASASGRGEIGRSEGLAIAAIGIVAGALRLAFLPWMEFKTDEAVALELAAAMLEGGEWARVGLVSSVGIPNPPAFIWWIAGAMQIARDPVVVTALAVGIPATAAVVLTWWILRDRAAPWLGLGAAATMACAPWAVLYARKIWAQDTLPLLCVCLLGALLAVAERHRTRAVFFVPVLVALLWQIHFSATGLAVVAGVVLAWRARALRGSALAAGTLVALLTLVPYGSHLHDTDFADFARLAGRSEAASARSDRIGIAEVFGAAARSTASISTGTDLAYALGRRSQAEFAERMAASPAAVAAAVGEGLGTVCLALGLVVVLVRTRPGDPRSARHRVLAIWALAYPAYLWLGNVDRIYPHYFVALYPVPFVLLATPLSELAARGGRPGRAAAAAVLAAVIAGQLAALGTFGAYVRERGGTGGDYGVAYRHKVALIDWAIREDRALSGRHGREYAYLLRTRRGGAAGESGAGGRFSVVDHLRRGPEIPAECTDQERFGPLSACVLD